MALAAGTVSVDGSGNVSGSGHARALYDAEAATLPAGLMVGDVGAYLEAFGKKENTPGQRGQVVAYRQKVATKCSAVAAATVALIQTGTAGGDPVL